MLFVACRLRGDVQTECEQIRRDTGGKNAICRDAYCVARVVYTAVANRPSTSWPASATLMGVRTYGQTGSADPPGKTDEKLKSGNMQKRAVFYVYVIFWEQSGQADRRCRERRYADHIFIQIYFRMHHFVVKFPKFSSPQAARGHCPPPNQNPADVPGWPVVGWLHTRPKTVTHPGTNRARRALTSFMRRTPLTTTPRRQPTKITLCVINWRRLAVSVVYHQKIT